MTLTLQLAHTLLEAEPCCPLTNTFCSRANHETLCCLSQTILCEINKLRELINCCCCKREENPCERKFVIRQSDIPFNARRSGYYCLGENVFFNGALVTNPGIEGPIAIAVSSPPDGNVVIDLNNHTLKYSGMRTNGIATIGSSAHITIKNGTIEGSNDADTAGILVLTNNVNVENVRIINASGSNSSAIDIQGAFLATPNSPTVILKPIDAILIDRCDFEGNNFGIQLNTFSNGVTIKNCTINNSVQMGITQPSRKNTASNVTIDKCTISNSGLNGIYTTYYQANWLIRDCQISNSGLNGMILACFQNLKVLGCQIWQCGAHGITASIRQSQNVEFADCQIFNTQDSSLRIDNVENLVIRNCAITNALPSSAPLLKVQDIYNGQIVGCTLNSTAGTAGGLFMRNCHGMLVDQTTANIFCMQPLVNCPIGFNLQGSVESTVIRNCLISGNPSLGIALTVDTLNGTDTGIVVENCTIREATEHGIAFFSATNSAIYGSKVISCTGDGIFLDTNTNQCSVRDNTLISNGKFGIENVGTDNKIYHNFAQGNGTDYSSGVPLVTSPAPHVGVLENIKD